MNRKHRQTLAAIFAHPERKNIRWDDFIALMIELGADVTRQGGSMTGLRLNERYAVFHCPHPGNEIYPSMLRRIRRFLKECGVESEEEHA